MIRKILFVLVAVAAIFISCSSSQAEGYTSVIETISIEADTVIESKFVNKSMKFKVLLPSSYYTLDSVPVIYLLHGYGGNEKSYPNYLPGLQALIDSLRIAVVCVNGEVGWYVNSAVNEKLKYEDYLVKELIPHINQNYKVGKSNKRHGVAGLSMGGFGSLYLAFKHPHLFAYVGGSSSCVDIKPYAGHWGIKGIFGDGVINAKLYEQNSPFYMLDSLTKESLKFKLVLDCGTQDFFFQDNQRFHKKLNDLGIQHDYYVSPGDHNWAYWKVSMPNHLRRFAKSVK